MNINTQQYINGLYELKDGECYFLLGIHRRKFGGQGNITYRHAIRSKERLLEKVAHYNTHNPETTLYLEHNPKSFRRAAIKMVKDLIVDIANGTPLRDLISISKTAVHVSDSHRIIKGFDFDTLDPVDVFARGVVIALEDIEYTVIQTAGGYHVLVDLESAKGNSTWYLALTALPDYDTTITASPIVGCTMGPECIAKDITAEVLSCLPE